MPSHLPWAGQAPTGENSITGLVSINREAGAAAGGSTVVITVTGRIGAPVPTFNGVAATVTGYTGTTLITCLTPAYAGTPDVGGTLVDVACGGFTLDDAFEYHPDPTTTFATHGFENGLLSPFATATGAAVTTDQAHTGSRSVEHLFTISEDHEALTFDYSSKPELTGNGSYQHFWIYISSAAQAAMSSGQIKLSLYRYPSGNSWMELGTGPEVNGASQTTIRLVGDHGTPIVNATGTYTYPVDTWIEIVQWYLRTGSTGTAKWWAGSGGALAFMGEGTGANMGEGNGSGNPRFTGPNYTQNGASHPFTVYTDDVTLANGWVE